MPVRKVREYSMQIKCRNRNLSFFLKFKADKNYGHKGLLIGTFSRKRAKKFFGPLKGLWRHDRIVFHHTLKGNVLFLWSFIGNALVSTHKLLLLIFIDICIFVLRIKFHR